MSARMWGSVVIFRSQKVPVSKNFWAALLYIHLHPHVVLTRRTKGRRLGNFQKWYAVSEIREHLTAKYVLTCSIIYAYIKL